MATCIPARRRITARLHGPPEARLVVRPGTVARAAAAAHGIRAWPRDLREVRKTTPLPAYGMCSHPRLACRR